MARTYGLDASSIANWCQIVGFVASLALNGFIIVRWVVRRLHLQRFLAGHWAGHMHFECERMHDSYFYNLEALITYDSSELKARMVYTGYRLIDGIREECLRGMDSLSEMEDGSKLTRTGLCFDLVCHREFHEDRHGIDANKKMVSTYECQVKHWITRPCITVRAMSCGEWMRGDLKKQ